MSVVSFTIYGQSKSLRDRRVGIVFKPTPDLTYKELLELIEELQEVKVFMHNSKEKGE